MLELVHQQQGEGRVILRQRAGDRAERLPGGGTDLPAGRASATAGRSACQPGRQPGGVRAVLAPDLRARPRGMPAASRRPPRQSSRGAAGH